MNLYINLKFFIIYYSSKSFLSKEMNYTEAIQKIELFSSFFDRLLAPSSNHNQHIQTLTKFKTALYSHIKNQKNIDTHIEELLGSKIQTPDTSSIKSHANSGSDSKPSHKLSTDLKSEPNSMTSLTETLQMLKENPNISEAAPFTSDYRQSINDLMTIFQLLSRLKATEHADINSLFLMAGDYSHVRTFEHAQYSAFLALSFAFYEKLLLRDLKPSSSIIIDSRLKKIINSEVDKQNAKKSAKSAYRELVLCLKDILEGKNTGNSILLFNLICSNQEMYGSSVSLFKEILHDLSPGFSLQSLNQPSNEALLKSLSSIMKSSIRFMLLNSQKLSKKEFHYSSENEIDSDSPTQRSRVNHDTTLFFDQRSNIAYLLYKSHGSKNSPTAKRANNSPSKGSRGVTLVPVQMGFPQPNFESEKRRMTMIPSHQDAHQPQNPQLINLLAASKSDKPRSLHEVNENETLSSGLTTKGRDPAPVHHTGEGGYLYNLNVIPPGSNTASLNLGHPGSLVGLSSFNRTNASITSVDNAGLLKPPNLGDDHLLGHSGSFYKHSSDLLNIGHLGVAKNESILSNVGNLLGDISSLSAKPSSLNEIKGETNKSVNDLSRAASDKAPITRRFSLKVWE